MSTWVSPMKNNKIKIVREIEDYLKTLLEKYHNRMPISELFKAFKLFETKYDIDIRYIESLDIEEDKEDKTVEYRSESYKIYDYNDKQFIAEIVVYTTRIYSDLSKQEIEDEIVEDVDVFIMRG